jgi:hypothetical protein
MTTQTNSTVRYIDDFGTLEISYQGHTLRTSDTVSESHRHHLVGQLVRDNGGSTSDWIALSSAVLQLISSAKE